MENVKWVKQAEAPSSGQPPHRHNKALGSLKYAQHILVVQSAGMISAIWMFAFPGIPADQ